MQSAVPFDTKVSFQRPVPDISGNCRDGASDAPLSASEVFAKGFYSTGSPAKGLGRRGGSKSKFLALLMSTSGAKTLYCCVCGAGAATGAGAGVASLGFCAGVSEFFFLSARRVFSPVVAVLFFFLPLDVSPASPNGPDCV